MKGTGVRFKNINITKQIQLSERKTVLFVNFHAPMSLGIVWYAILLTLGF